jgi:hypothetical protein
MSSVLIILLVAAVAAIAITLIIASRRPDEFSAARSMTIAAPPARLHGLINDLRQMNTWNPYALRDCGGVADYSGPDSGPGATFHFAGKGGTGTVSIVDSSPSVVGMRLKMTKPIAGDNRVEFRLKPVGTATEVTWAMHGMQSLPGKIFSLFVDCERMMARDFDEGLTNLKAIAERS